VKAPPRRGPTTDAIPNILERAATYMARLLRGTEYDTMIIPPENRADAPIPAIARPTISMGELTAAAHITEPTGWEMRVNRSRRVEEMGLPSKITRAVR
jgi:hypothetical protein